MVCVCLHSELEEISRNRVDQILIVMYRLVKLLEGVEEGKVVRGLV
jgi:hypothetical protein